MSKEWRPEGWRNPYKGDWPDNDRINFEMGASAMLSARDKYWLEGIDGLLCDFLVKWLGAWECLRMAEKTKNKDLTFSEFIKAQREAKR
jgi:hypothetical protein